MVRVWGPGSAAVDVVAQVFSGSHLELFDELHAPESAGRSGAEWRRFGSLHRAEQATTTRSSRRLHVMRPAQSGPQLNRPRLLGSRHRSRGALSVSGALGTARLKPETSRSICQILARKLISIWRQPLLLAASRCYLIQMLRSALTCTNGCSCWSPDEENSSGFFLTMDALYRLS